MVVLDTFALKLYPGSFDFYGTEKHEKFGTIMVLVSTIISCLIYFIKVSAMIFLKVKYFALFIRRFNETPPPPTHTHTQILIINSGIPIMYMDALILSVKL